MFQKYLAIQGTVYYLKLVQRRTHHDRPETSQEKDVLELWMLVMLGDACADTSDSL